MNYMGIDHHRQYSHITLLDEKGEVVKSGRVVNLRRELENFLFGVKEVKAVVEAGRSSYTMVDVLEDLGMATAVAHPKEVKAIAKAKVKTDERDSYKPARLLRTGDLSRNFAHTRPETCRNSGSAPGRGLSARDVGGCRLLPWQEPRFKKRTEVIDRNGSL